MNARGLTLVEVLVALVILGLAAGVTLAAFMTQLDSNTRNEVRTAAISAGEVVLEDLRMEDPATLPGSGSDSPRLVAVGDQVYEVVVYYCERSDLCSADSRYLRVDVLQNGRSVYDVETIFTQLR